MTTVLAPREPEPADVRLPADVLDSLLEGCQVISFDWRYLYINQKLAQQGGKPKEELLGRTMMECYPGIEHTPMFSTLRRCMQERRFGELENEFQFADGRRGIFELRFVPVPQGICILSLDVTEARQRYAAIVNDSQDAIIARNLEGVVLSYNHAANELFGYSAAELLGQKLTPLYPEALRDEERELLSRVEQGERIGHYETQRRRKDGTLIEVAVTLSPIRDASGAIVGVSKIARDITERKRAQRELQLAKEQAEAANRELESFSYSVAHDLRAPLRSIDGFSQALLEDYPDKLDETGKKYLHFVRESAQLMAQLIDDMLTLSRVTRSDFRTAEVDLSSLARASLARLQREQPERPVTVEVENGMLARGDSRLLRVALDNLLGNAWKFTSKRALARIEVGSLRRDGEITYYVKDNGAGFDMAYADKLFGVFQRLHSAHEFEGTGVGLATVQRIVWRHGGRVWGEAKVDEGASFYFTLGNRES